jgi:hypothetical protein
MPINEDFAEVILRKTIKEDRAGKIDAARKLFHELWTKEVGTPGYDKKKWMELQWLLTQLGIPV